MPNKILEAVSGAHRDIFGTGSTRCRRLSGSWLRLLQNWVATTSLVFVFLFGRYCRYSGMYLTHSMRALLLAFLLSYHASMLPLDFKK